MVVLLKDEIDTGRYLELSFLYHNRDEDEGSKLVAKFYSENCLELELKFRWTNQVLQLFIDLLKQFPIEKYKGVFSHYEKHLEMRWQSKTSSDIYDLTFDLLAEDEDEFSISVSKKNVHDFGLALDLAMQNAPTPDEYNE
ncbi:hypothetical protein ACFVS2_09610 [Brevibacillus sp. NPDC058079]|uniref:hypothetical protein n=1 Tax=Brevibacillus sp. NPDC058079 TaxID=3346330 RepID=UPI0036F18939